jgi:hypothetical protein
MCSPLHNMISLYSQNHYSVIKFVVRIGNSFLNSIIYEITIYKINVISQTFNY